VRFFSIDKVIQEEGLYVYNMDKIVEKHFSVRVTPVLRVRVHGCSDLASNNIV
jgi:hypothetical protein